MFIKMQIDKKRHMKVGLLIYTVALALLFILHLQTKETVLYSTYATIAVAVGKELLDYKSKKHNAEVLDAMATFALPSAITSVWMYWL